MHPDPQDDARVVDVPSAGRFELRVGDQLAGFVEYSLRSGSIALNHTEISDAFGGRGLGGVLARGALDSARARRLSVLIRCPFLRAWIDKHPDYADLLAPDAAW